MSGSNAPTDFKIAKFFLTLFPNYNYISTQAHFKLLSTTFKLYTQLVSFFFSLQVQL